MEVWRFFPPRRRQHLHSREGGLCQPGVLRLQSESEREQASLPVEKQDVNGGRGPSTALV